MPQHVVVTGAGGFVGGFLATWFAGRGRKVTAISRRPVAPAAAPCRLSWRVADLCAPAALPERFDALIHCAAEIPARCPDPSALYSRNLDASRNVFGRALDAGARSVVFLSSMSVYGSIDVPVVTEDTVPRNPDPYGKAKRDAEGLLAAAVEGDLASGLALRLPGTVGRGSHHNFLSDALARVLAREDVHARNPEALFNNIVYVGDLARFLEAWVDRPRDGLHVANLAARDPLTIRELLSLLFALCGQEERLIFEPGDKVPFLISLDRALTLGYRPASVRESLAAFVADSTAAG